MIRFRSLLALAPCLMLVACGGASPTPETPAAPEPAAPVPSAPEAPTAPETEAPKADAPAPVEVKIEARSGSKLSGSARLEATEGGVKVTLMVSGAPPGTHGAHIHEKADCSAPDGKSAGGHFNPGGHDHGLPPGQTRHLGDLGNIEIAKNGEGKLEIVIAGANLEPGHEHSFLDRGIIIHEKTDDGGQPTGNAGGRIGCAEIKR
jgi:Cu-Zn family superoxide dismutase